MKPWTLIALNIRKCITLCNLFWNVWYFPSYVYWLYLRNDKEVPAAIGSIMPKQENVQGDKKKSSPHLSLPFEPGHLSRNPVADRPLCLSVHFQTSPWPGEGKGVIGSSTQDLPLELEMRSPSPDPLGGGVAGWKQTNSNSTPISLIGRRWNGCWVDRTNGVTASSGKLMFKLIFWIK